MLRTKIKATNRAFDVSVLCYCEMGGCDKEIKGLLLGCNVIAFEGQYLCLCEVIALLL